MFWIIIVSFAVLLVLCIVIYLMPSETKPKKKEKKVHLAADPLEVDKSKDWKTIAERWEKQNHGFAADIEKSKMDQRKLQQEIDHQKTENKTLVEKLSQEKSWREKEQLDVERTKKREITLKEEIRKAEADLQNEHSSRLKYERDLQELKIKHDAIAEENKRGIKPPEGRHSMGG